MRNRENKELLESVKKGDISGVKKALKKGAKINTTFGKKERTVLMYAIINHDYPMVELIIENGAELEIIDYKGDSALDIATKSKIPLRERENITANRKIIDLLIDKGASLTFSQFRTYY